MTVKFDYRPMQGEEKVLAIDFSSRLTPGDFGSQLGEKIRLMVGPANAPESLSDYQFDALFAFPPNPVEEAALGDF